MTDGAAFDVLVLALGPLGAVAVPAHHVREVARVDRITEYPGAPADVRGVTTVRGQIVPVLDLAPRGSGEQTVILLVVGTRGLAIAGATPVRVAAVLAVERGAAGAAPLVLWSGRVLPLAGAVRLADAARLEAADGPTLPLLDAAALIHDTVDHPDDES